MPVRGLEDCCGVVGWAFNANALDAIATDCAADDGTDTTENNNSAEEHVAHYRDEWSLPNTANDGDICITDNNGAVWVWNGWCWRDRDGTTLIQTQPDDAARSPGGYGTVRGLRARYPIIEDLNDINTDYTYTIDWDHVQIGVDADGNPTIHAHVEPVVSYPDNDNTSEVPSEEFADIFEVAT